jgi:hypothetical protein
MLIYAFAYTLVICNKQQNIAFWHLYFNPDVVEISDVI